MKKDHRERPTVNDILNLDILAVVAKKLGIFLGNRGPPKSIKQLVEEKR